MLLETAAARGPFLFYHHDSQKVLCALSLEEVSYWLDLVECSIPKTTYLTCIFSKDLIKDSSHFQNGFYNLE